MDSAAKTTKKTLLTRICLSLSALVIATGIVIQTTAHVQPAPEAQNSRTENAAPELGFSSPVYAETSSLADFVIKSPLDQFIADKLVEAKLQPSPVCTDEEFIRRAYLDVVGVIPTGPAVARFLDDRNPKKREKLVADLLTDERYGTNWAVLWGDLLREHYRGKPQEGSEAGSYRDWIRKQLNENVPYDQFVKSLITSSGRAEDNGAANFYLRDERDRVETVNTVASVFMGTRMACAQCHDHPFDKWEQQDFHSVMAFFEPRTAVLPDEVATLANFRNDKGIPDDVREKIKPYLDEAEKAYKAEEEAEKKAAENKLGGSTGPGMGMGMGGPGMGMGGPGMMPGGMMDMAKRAGIMRRMEEDVKKSLGEAKADRLRQALQRNRVNKVIERPIGDYRMPADASVKTKKPGPGGDIVPAVFPWDKSLKSDGKGSRREDLAKFVTSSHRFAEVQVNRIWDHLFGHALVDPVDDFRPKNPASHPELLTWLADEFIKLKFDNKKIIQVIMCSSTYERSSLANQSNRKDTTLYSHFKLRRMSAEQIFDSILVASGHKDGLRDLGTKREAMRMMDAEVGGKGKGGMAAAAKKDSMEWAADIPTPARQGSFLNVFNQPDREQLTIERDTSGSITQALELMNGNSVNQAVLVKQGSFSQHLLDSKFTPEQMADQIYLAVLSRRPTAKEKSLAVTLLRPRPDALEDFLWAMMNTREFMFIK